MEKFFTMVWVGSRTHSFESVANLDKSEGVKEILYFDNNDADQCLDCLKLMSNECILVVLSDSITGEGTYETKLLTKFNNLRQVQVIFVHRQYRSHQSVRNLRKIKYFSNENLSLSIQAVVRAYFQVTEPFQFNTFDHRSSLTLNGDFLHYQILIDSFVRCPYPPVFIDNYSTFTKGKADFLATYRDMYRNENGTLAKLEQFEHNYTPEQVVRWYTEDSFLFKTLNRSLRMNDIKSMLLFRFFIIDLRKHLEEFRYETIAEDTIFDFTSSSYYAYRGQLMSKDELNNLRKSLNHIISVKSFLSTSLDKTVASFYLGHLDDGTDSLLIPVLIEINLGDNSIDVDTRSLFANITNQSTFGDEEKEVLFMAGTLFRVNEVRYDNSGIWCVSLGVMTCFDNTLQHGSMFGALYDQMLNHSVHPDAINRANTGTALFQAGKFDEAQRFYEKLLEHLENLVEEPDDDNDETIDEIGTCPTFSSNNKNETGGIFQFLQDLSTATPASDKQESFELERTEYILMCRYMLGRIFHEKGLYSLSKQYYSDVLQRTPPPNPNSFVLVRLSLLVLPALCHIGLGATFASDGKSQRAHESYNEALKLFKEISNDRYCRKDVMDSAQLYGAYLYEAYCIAGLADVLLMEEKVEQARSFYRDALELFNKYLPRGHPDQWRIRQKIAKITDVHEHQPKRALEDYNDCLQNYLRTLPSDHVDIGRLYDDMACSYEQLPNSLDTALKHAKQAASIFEASLPKDHSDNLKISNTINRIEKKLSLES